MCRLGPGGDTRAYIWRRSWRKFETRIVKILVSRREPICSSMITVAGDACLLESGATV
jgi:hypothetical protein